MRTARESTQILTVRMAHAQRTCVVVRMTGARYTTKPKHVLSVNFLQKATVGQNGQNGQKAPQAKSLDGIVTKIAAAILSRNIAVTKMRRNAPSVVGLGRA